MKTRSRIYARLIAAMCDADKRNIHWPTQVNSRINSVHHFAEVYEANADAMEAALRQAQGPLATPEHRETVMA